MEDEVKLLPSGIYDFARIRRENYYYVDKTQYIEKIERDSSYMLIVRPRRFGKSLFLSTLESYYDVKAKDDFDDLFSGLYIHEHPTKWRNYYQVLTLDFSQVGGTFDDLEEKFNSYLAGRLNLFAKKYEDMYYPGFAEELNKEPIVTARINIIANEAKLHGYHLYLILDEYDNFTNTVWSLKGEDVYKSITHGEGFYRDIFKKFKGNFERIFITGVSPITLDDLTSGFNIATYASNESGYNQMFGFSESEITEMIKYYVSAGLIDGDPDAVAKNMVEVIKPWCDNYCFSYNSFVRNEPKMFNGMMTLEYLSYYIKNKEFPEDMFVPNAMIDYPKLDHLIRLDRENFRDSIIRKIVDDGVVYERISTHFPASDVVKSYNFVSLLYYYGMLSISGTEGLMCKLSIPNNNVRTQYYKYIMGEYDKYTNADLAILNKTFNAAAIRGNYTEMFSYIAKMYKEVAVNRNSIEGERNIQGFFMAYLSLNPYYLMKPEIELNHGYGDLFLMPDRRFNFVNHCYIVEFKYIAVSATDKEVTEALEAATKQLNLYADDAQIVKMIGISKLHKIVMVFKGFDVEKMEEI
jgi:hypothetical protein